MITKTLTQRPITPITSIRTRDDLIDEGVRRFFSELSSLGVLAEDLADSELDRLIPIIARQMIPLGRSLGREALYEALEDLHDITVHLVTDAKKKAGKLKTIPHDEVWAEIWAQSEQASELLD